MSVAFSNKKFQEEIAPRAPAASHPAQVDSAFHASGQVESP